jgi:excisionase family DNA binding protein
MKSKTLKYVLAFKHSGHIFPLNRHNNSQQEGKRMDILYMLSANQAAELLGMSRPTLNRHMKEGGIPFHKEGNRLIIFAHELKEYKPKKKGRPRVPGSG